MSGEALRPLGVGEILDAGIKVYVRNARTLMALCAIVVVPFQVLSAFVTLSTARVSSEVPRGLSGLGATDRAASTGGSLVVTLIGFVVGLLTTAACVKAVSDVYLDRPPSVGESLRFVVRRLGQLVWLEILTVILLFLAFIVLVVPGIWLYAAWSVATPALLIEGAHGARALGRSRRLVRGRWWPTAGLLVAANIMVVVAGGAITAALTAITLSGAGQSVAAVVLFSSIASVVSAVLTRPFQAAVTTVLYYDLRVRHEGYDVELLASQLGIVPPDLPPLASIPGAGLPLPAGLPPGLGPASVGRPGGPPFWPPPPGWQPPPSAPPPPPPAGWEPPPPARGPLGGR